MAVVGDGRARLQSVLAPREKSSLAWRECNPTASFRLILLQFMPDPGPHTHGADSTVTQIHRLVRAWTDSDPEEDLPSPHPEQHKPKYEQCGCAEQERLKGRSENLEAVRPEVRLQRAHDEALKEMGDDVGGNGIRPDDQ